MMRIVFDFAGVLFHWQPRALLRRTLPHLAVDEASAAWLEQQIFQGYGGDWAEFDRGCIEVPELVRRIAARTGLAPADVLRVIDAVPGELQPVPGTVALLRRLHAAGRRLHFLSNMPEPYAAHLEREHGFLDFFESGVISARVQQIKPEAGIFDTAARAFGAAPAELLFIDDVAANVHAARRAGWQGLQFVDPVDCAARLLAGGWA
jgi:putative hydrolase of the HAD superfamily